MPEVSMPLSEPGYNLRWRVSAILIQKKELEKQLRSLHRWRKKDFISRYTELTSAERQCVSRYVNEYEFNNGPDRKLTIFGLGFKKI